MDTKKVVIGVFAMIAVLLIVIIVWDVVFNNNLVEKILNRILAFINKAFNQVTGNGGNIVDKFNESGVNKTKATWGGKVS